MQDNRHVRIANRSLMSIVNFKYFGLTLEIKIIFLMKLREDTSAEASTATHFHNTLFSHVINVKITLSLCLTK